MDLSKKYELLNNVNIILSIVFLHNIIYKPAFTIILLSSFFMLILAIKYKKVELKLYESATERTFWLLNIAFVVSMILSSSFTNVWQRSMYMALEYLYWWLPFFMMLFFLHKEKNFECAYQGIALAGVFISSWAIYQKIILGMFRPAGFYPNPNTLAACIALVLPTLILGYQQYSKDKTIFANIAYLSSIAITSIGLIITESRGAMLGLFIAITVYIVIFERKNLGFIKKYLASCAIILLLTLMISPNVVQRTIGVNFKDLNADMGRKLVMQSSLAMWQEHKLWGVGLGNFQKNYEQQYVLPEARERKLPTAHNTILHYLAESGFFTASLYVLMMAYHLFYTYKNSKNNLWCKIMFVTILVLNIHSLVDTLYIVKPINRMYWCLLGITFAFTRYKSKVENVRQK